MNRSVVTDSFVIDRQYSASLGRCFSAFADPAVKRLWFGNPSDTSTTHELDFRVGGRESIRGSAPGGAPTFTYDAVYQDIVDAERIVYTYDMTMDGKRISVSVATLEFLAVGGGTRLILTEQGAFLDGLDTNAIRAQGTTELLETLAGFLGNEAPS